MANVTVLSSTGPTIAGIVYSELPASINSVLQSILTSSASATVISVSGADTIPPTSAPIVVNAPGSSTIVGTSDPTVLLGSTSDVLYSVSGGAGSIYAAGGSDSIIVGTPLVPTAFDIVGTGADTVNYLAGSDTLDAQALSNDLAFIHDAEVTIEAIANSTVAAVFAPNSGGTLDFINNSNQAQTVYSGAYTTAGGQNIAAVNAVTAFGGAGGGFYVGGLAGNNSLIGGSGVVTLVGGGNNDFLEASSNVSTNIMFGGPGSETLLGSSISGANNFNLGLSYVGLGTISGNDLVSTAGTGLQSYNIGAGSFTITGSDAVSASGFANIYDVVRDASVAGANITITDFSSRDIILLTDQTEAAGNSMIHSIVSDTFGGTAITLADHTVINLIGINPAGVSTIAGAHGIIGIVDK